MKEVAAYPGTLCLPVKPQASSAVVEMIVSYDYIYGGMHLYTADLSTGKVLFIVYVMDMIVLYYREDTAQMSYNACLTAVMNVVVPDYV